MLLNARFLTIYTKGNMNDILDKIIEYGITQKASDIHICSGEVVRYRIDNNIVSPFGQPVNSDKIVDKILSYLPGEEFRSKLQSAYADGDEIDFSLEFCQSRLRVNAFRDFTGDNIAVRILDKHILTPREIGLPEALVSLSRRANGIIIIAGASGSGKSTTLASLIELANNERNLHIITIEDPIEYVFKSKKCLINQRQVGLHTKSFASGLKSALREDPDIIMIGEMRDQDTVRAAMKLAETGHLVLATMHTSSSSGCIERIIDYFTPEEQRQIRTVLSDALLCVLIQSLIPAKNSTRTAAFEFLISNAAVKNLIRESKTNMIQNVLQTSSNMGMITMKESYTRLVQKGVITLENARKYYPNGDFTL